ncbi:MAG: DUF1043 family protein [Gammaproteobacteria bacterium]|nr:DUF1043 family protein [Gammaproteobacteria bacterium]
MFGEISLLTWLGGVIVFAIGSGAGFFVARQLKDKRTKELEQQLQATQSRLTEYQDEVNRHFLKSSLLFNKLTDNYREVYEHLATGAQKLCNEKPLTTALNLPDTKILPTAAASRAGTQAIAAAKSPTRAANSNPAPTEHHSEQIARNHTSGPADELTDEQAEQLGVESSVNHQAMFERQAEAKAAENAVAEKNGSSAKQTTAGSPERSSRRRAESTSDQHRAIGDTPTITEAELKILEASELARNDEDEIPLGVESTPGVEPEHHKTHPAIH